MSSPLRQVFSIVAPALVIVLALAGIIYPFCIIRNTGSQNGQTRCCSGQPRWWHPNTLPVPITINRTGSTQAPGEATANAVRRAMATWNNIASSFFEFSDAGLTDRDFSANDAINIVVFDVEGINFVPGSMVLAISRTMSTTDALGYRAIDSDMVYNARDYEWTAGPSTLNSFDIESVALHEFGHHLGLDHAGGRWDVPKANSGCGPVIPGAVMFYAVSQGTIKRVLHADDAAGITQIYPEWQVEGSVFDDAGQPVANAEVRFLGTRVPKDTIAVPALRTDQMGRYFGAVLDPQFSISASRFGYQDNEISVSFSAPGIQSFDFQLLPLATSSIRGTVRDDATGRGLSARVELYVEGEVLQSVQTTNGNFEFANVPVTDPRTTNYQKVRVVPELPFPLAESTQELLVEAGQPTVLNFNLAAAQALLVDKDGGSSYETFYTTALEKINFSYVVWNGATQGAATAALKFFPQKPVIWWTGNGTTNLLLPAERDSLRAHLRRGGSLLLTGQNIAEYLSQSDSLFLRDLLRVRWGGNLRDPIAHGVTGDPIGQGLRNIALGGGDGASNQTSQDLLLPQAGANVCIIFDTTRNNAAGVRVDQAISGVAAARVAFFGFGLEAVNGVPPGFAKREQVLSNTLNWLTGIPNAVTLPSYAAGTPDRFALLPNYPNPFNGNTEIAFYIPGYAANHVVTVKIFDTLGRELRTLVEEPLPAGEHRVHWDGRDHTGLPLATGLYLYQMAAEQFVAVRKLLYVK